MKTWVINTGATDHIVCFVDLLTSITAISHTMVQLPNGEAAIVTHVGTVQLSSHITLTNVLCVPSVSFNLLSVISMTKTQPLRLIFLSAYCFIQDLTNWSTFGVGQMFDGLYLLQQSSLLLVSTSLVDFLSKHKIGSFTAFSSNNHHNKLYSLWHSRLGHPSDVKLQSLSNVFPFLQNCCTKQCTVCPLAKQKGLPFPFNNKMCDFPFDLVYMDVWGPFFVPTSDGHRYFLTLVDDATGATWLFLMKAKFEVKALIVSSYNMVFTQFNVKIKCFRSDNALESNFLIFILLKASFTKLVVFILHNKILLWRENISIFYLLLGLCKFSPICLFLFGVIVCSLLSILLIDYSLLFYKIKLHLNFCLAKFLLILILGLLVAYVFLPPLVVSPLSSLLEPGSVFLLVIPTMSKVINFLIFYLTLFLSLEM